MNIGKLFKGQRATLKFNGIKCESIIVPQSKIFLRSCDRDIDNNLCLCLWFAHILGMTLSAYLWIHVELKDRNSYYIENKSGGGHYTIVGKIGSDEIKV